MIFFYELTRVIISPIGIIVLLGTLVTLFERKKHKDQKETIKINSSIIMLIIFSLIMGSFTTSITCLCGTPLIGKPAFFFIYASIIFNWIYNFLLIRKNKQDLIKLFLINILEISIALLLALTLASVFPFEHIEAFK